MSKKFNDVKIRVLLGVIGLLTVVPSPSAYAQSDNSEINAVEIIFEHVQDSYWWHITTINDQHLSVYLPVIVYSSTTGWHVFSSSRLTHDVSYKGFYIASGGDHAGKIVLCRSEERRVGKECRSRWSPYH